MAKKIMKMPKGDNDSAKIIAAEKKMMIGGPKAKKKK